MATTSGLHAINNGIININVGGAAVPSDFQPAIVTNSYYFGLGFDPAGGAMGWSVDVLYAWPFWVSHDETWTRIGVECVDNVAATNMRLGIYSNGTDNRPGALLLDAGAVSLASFGALEITISQALSANTLYWLAAVHNDASELITTRAYSNSLVKSDFARRFGLLGMDFGFPGFNRSFTYAALPDPWGTPDNNDSGAPALWLRKV